MLIGNGKHDAPVRMLEDIRVIMVEQALDDDMAALDQAQMPALPARCRLLQELGRPRPGRIDDAARTHG
ncbi:hypothetical protein D3C81_2120250 [compost metagenome]